MKTSELIGPALDWAVAKCEGIKLSQVKDYTGAVWAVDGDVLDFTTGEQINDGEEYAPSRIWSQGGPIIEREKIELKVPEVSELGPWMALQADASGDYMYRSGPTPLISAMRCYVSSKLGDEVEIPEELK